MSFTKRDYEAIASIIAHGNAYASAYPRGPMANEYIRGYRHALNHARDTLSAHFAADNPRFDAERFARACEPGSGK